MKNSVNNQSTVFCLSPLPPPSLYPVPLRKTSSGWISVLGPGKGTRLSLFPSLLSAVSVLITSVQTLLTPASFPTGRVFISLLKAFCSLSPRTAQAWNWMESLSAAPSQHQESWPKETCKTATKCCLVRLTNSLGLFKCPFLDNVLIHSLVLSEPWWNISAVSGTGKACPASSFSGPWGRVSSPPDLDLWRRWS